MYPPWTAKSECEPLQYVIKNPCLTCWKVIDDWKKTADTMCRQAVRRASGIDQLIKGRTSLLHQGECDD